MTKETGRRSIASNKGNEKENYTGVVSLGYRASTHAAGWVFAL
jgi:hypothetical protein